MRELPIHFNSEMVRAVLEGRKVQTRRIMKVQPKPSKSRSGDFYFPCKKLQTMVHVSDFKPGNRLMPDVHEFFSICCPFGAVGDRLWVKETWARYNIDQDSHDMAYRATIPDDWPKEGRWRPSIHMPRWASRITLEITGVRVERLTALSDDDARNEGCPAQLPHNPEDEHQARTWFRGLWSEIYGEESWQANPWVWVIEFQRVGGDS